MSINFMTFLNKNITFFESFANEFQTRFGVEAQVKRVINSIRHPSSFKNALIGLERFLSESPSPTPGVIFKAFQDCPIKDLNYLVNEIDSSQYRGVASIVKAGKNLIENRKDVLKGLASRVNDVWQKKQCFSVEDISSSLEQLAAFCPEYDFIYLAFQNIDISDLRCYRQIRGIPQIVSKLLMDAEDFLGAQDSLANRLVKQVKTEERLSKKILEVSQKELQKFHDLKAEQKELEEQDKQLTEQENAISAKAIQKIKNKQRFIFGGIVLFTGLVAAGAAVFIGKRVHWKSDPVSANGGALVK